MFNKFGKWKIYAIESGEFRLDGGAMMGSVPKVLWEKTNPADELNRINLSLRCLLLDDGDKKILVETGMGDNLEPDFTKMFHICQSEKPLKQKLHEKGYKLSDITHVILTHLHFDHSGGATTLDCNQNLVPTFPNAKYFVSATNWEAALNPNPRDSASYLKQNFLPLKEYNCLELLPDNSEILEGISSITVNGHTFGQQLIKLKSNDETLVFCADLIPLKSQLKLPWIMGYDLNAILTLKEKTNFLNQAAFENWWLWFYHDPNTVAVKVKEGEKYFEIIEEIHRD